MPRAGTAISINFLIGITRGCHHTQIRNSPWTMFPNGVNATKKRTVSAPGFALSMAQHEFLSLQVRDAGGPWRVSQNRTI